MNLSNKSDRLRRQVEEALGPINKWYCSQRMGYEVKDPNKLMEYYIKSGAAARFAEWYDEATGPANRWYCSEYFGYPIEDIDVLIDYYFNHVGVEYEVSI